MNSFRESCRQSCVWNPSSSNNADATRTIIVELDNEEEGGKTEHRRDVQYDLPPANGKTRWRDMHHEREKAALTKRFPVYRFPDGGQGEE